MKRVQRLALAVSLLALATVVGATSLATFEQLTVDTTVGGVRFTATKIQPNGGGTSPAATLATCRLRTAEISFTLDGTAPTTTVGTLLEVNETLTVTGTDFIKAFRAIRTGGTSGQLDCTYSAP